MGVEDETAIVIFVDLTAYFIFYLGKIIYLPFWFEICASDVHEIIGEIMLFLEGFKSTIIDIFFAICIPQCIITLFINLTVIIFNLLF